MKGEREDNVLNIAGMSGVFFALCAASTSVFVAIRNVLARNIGIVSYQQSGEAWQVRMVWRESKPFVGLAVVGPGLFWLVLLPRHLLSIKENRRGRGSQSTYCGCTHSLLETKLLSL